MHYAVPRILHAAGSLERFFTDICATVGWPRLLAMIPKRCMPTRVQRLSARVPYGIPANRITAFNAFGVRYARRVASADIAEQAFLEGGIQFCELVLREDWDGATAVYVFNSAGLEIMQSARKRGLKTFMEQTIAPKELEMELLRSEHERFPDWEIGHVENLSAKAYSEREKAEWQVADTILCGSDFVRDGIARCGGPVEKCVVVPYGVDIKKQNAEMLKAGSRKQKAVEGEEKAEIGNQELEIRCQSQLPEFQPSAFPVSNFPQLRVLTVGAVGLRKGSPYVREAAKRMKGRAIFRMAGSVVITSEAQVSLRESVELLGSIPRSEIGKYFEWADVFLLPSICEGSATVVYEALAHGLPVICTPNTGSVVRDGVDGFIVPARDVESIVDRLEQLRANPGLRAEMSVNARARSSEFTVAAYGRRLLEALSCSKTEKLKG